MKTIDELERKVKETADLLTSLKIELAEARVQLAMLTPIQRIAIRLHDATCRWNHTDGCGWYYEISKGEHNWSGSSHKGYLEKAENLVRRCSGNYERAEQALDSAALIGGL